MLKEKSWKYNLKAKTENVSWKWFRMKLPHGKIPVDLLNEVVFKHLGIDRREVVLGPSAGIDGAIIEAGDRSLIFSMDPITGALERIGWLAVNVNANDVATFGVEPAVLFSCILLPEDADRKTVETICVQMDKAARKLGIAIAGGHCEVTPGLPTPIVVGCTFGIARKGKYVTAGGANNGDKLILTKSAGIEGTTILASDREEQLRRVMSKVLLKRAKQFYKQISVVRDARIAFKTGGVHAMHDPTEGGVTGAIHEMADASRLGVKVFQEKIRIEPETARICKFYRIDPLQLIASGSLLIAVQPEFSEDVVWALKKKSIAAEIIGEFLPSPKTRLIIRKSGKVEDLARPVADHLWRALQSMPTG
jgi:hydrogenase expression/formation protein HypE